MPSRRIDYLTSILFILISAPLQGQASPVLSSSQSTVVSFSHHCHDHAYLLCDLSFTTDLNTLQTPDLTCKTLTSNATQPHLDTTIEKEWTFLTELGNTVYKVEGSLSMDTTTKVTISSLSLCFSTACSSSSSPQTCLSFTPTSAFSTTTTTTSSSQSSFLMKSNAEGFVFNTGSGDSSSTESNYKMHSSAEGFVFNMGSGDSSSPNYSSHPEGFVFNFGSESSTNGV